MKPGSACTYTGAPVYTGPTAADWSPLRNALSTSSAKPTRPESGPRPPSNGRVWSVALKQPGAPASHGRPARSLVYGSLAPRRAGSTSPCFVSSTVSCGPLAHVSREFLMKHSVESGRGGACGGGEKSGAESPRGAAAPAG